MARKALLMCKYEAENKAKLGLKCPKPLTNFLELLQHVNITINKASHPYHFLI